MTLKDAAQFISDVGEAWIGLRSDRTIYEVTSDAAIHCSSDPTFNVAAWLKHNYGFKDMTDAEYLEEAKTLIQVYQQTH